MSVHLPWALTDPAGAVSPPATAVGRVPRWVAITAVELVIAIHVVLTPMHLMETLYVGVLFVVGNVLLFTAVLLMAGRRAVWLGWLVAAAVCAGEFVAFVLSRTVGLPSGYHETWASSPEDYLGLASLGCETVVLVAAFLVWRNATTRGR